MWIDGSYVAPLRVIPGGVRAHTHLAQIRIGTQLVTAYVKAFEAGRDRWLFNELAGGLIARRAGIGAPPGGLLWVPLPVLQSLFSAAHFSHHLGLVLCYACAPVDNGYGLAAIGLGEATGKVLEEVRKVLLAWPGFAACVAFDQWVANIDRHANNLLVAGGGRLVPIDHSDCFGGPEQQDDDFNRPHAWYRNRLVDELFDAERLTLPTKAAIVLAGERLPGCHQQCAKEAESLRPWLGEPLGLHWCKWLETRAVITAQLLRERVRMLI